MTQQKINDALAELRREIEQLEIGDKDVKERLGSLVKTIEQRMTPDLTAEEHHNLLLELKDIITEFEVKHPSVTGIVSEILMTLSNMGI